jgi:hypothetical protein
MRWFVALIAFASFGGCLRLDSPDGSLLCSTNAKRLCPEGYYCLAGGNTCWRDGHFPDDMAEPGQGFPGGGDDLSVPVDDLSTELDLGTPIDLTPNDDLLDTD